MEIKCCALRVAPIAFRPWFKTRPEFFHHFFKSFISKDFSDRHMPDLNLAMQDNAHGKSLALRTKKAKQGVFRLQEDNLLIRLLALYNP